MIALFHASARSSDRRISFPEKKTNCVYSNIYYIYIIYIYIVISILAALQHFQLKHIALSLSYTNIISQNFNENTF